MNSTFNPCLRVLAFSTLLFPVSTLALTNNIALTPQMGWNAYDAYGCGPLGEVLETNAASLIASNGMAAAGYQYINIDDGWAATRDSNGVIQAYSIPDKFPHGIEWLADYVHAFGLKLGIYTDHGTNTCSSCVETSIDPTGKQPGSFNYEYLDAFTYAQWGVDYLKDDSCNLPVGDVPMNDYFRMADGLLKSGRPIFFSLCENQPHYEYWSPLAGNSWRTTGDIKDTFASMISKIDQNSKSAYVAGPGRFNDPDMLEIGNGEFSTNYVAAETHFTMWCEMAAPLISGIDVSNITPQSLAILTNAEAIAVDQDPACEQGIFVDGVRDSAEVWSKPLGYDFTTRAVVLLNRSSSAPAVITCNFTNLAFQPGTTATVRDLWTHQDLGTFTNSFTATVTNYGSMLLKIVGMPVPPPAFGTNYLSSLQPIYLYVASNDVWLAMNPNKSIAGNTLTLGGVTYSNGLGVCAMSGAEYNLGGLCSRFQATVGLDDEVGGRGSVIFQAFADGTKIYDSGIVTGSSPAQTLNLDVTGVRRLTLGVTDTGNDSIDASTRDSYCDSDWANALVIVTNTTPQVPETPTGLAAIPGNAITLTWNDTLAALTYNVKRGIQSGGPYTNLANVPVVLFTDTNVVSGMTYYYVVSAVSSLGEGANSLEASGSLCYVPVPPTNLATTADLSQITVTWNASAGATSYNVYRFTGNTPPVIIASNLVTNNFTDTPLAGSTTNYYLVTAANACNQSGYSLYAPGITPPGPPDAPTGLSATPGNALVDLNWNAAANATGYDVMRSTTNGGPYDVIASNITATAFLDTTVTNGTTYYYVIAALNAGGASPDSAQVSVTPVAPVTVYWTGTDPSNPGYWDVGVSENWQSNGVASTYGQGDLVTFNDTATGQKNIELMTVLTPGSLTVSNNAVVYDLGTGGAGGGRISGATGLTKGGGNLLILDESSASGSYNDFTGGLTISAGTVQVGNGGPNGWVGTGPVVDNGLLIFDRSDTVTNANVISGSGSVAQKGTGVLTLGGSNTFAGGTLIQNGMLRLGNSSALGPAGSQVVITNGGTLDIDGFSSTGAVVTVSGAGTGGNGALMNNGAQQTSAFGNVTLAGDTTLGGNGRWDIRSSGATLSTGGQLYKITKVGPNQISVVGTTVDPQLGDVDIQQGEFAIQTSTVSQSGGFGNPTNVITVHSNATLETWNLGTSPLNKQIVVQPGGTLFNESANSILGGDISLQGNCLIIVSNRGASPFLTIAGPMSGPGGITKIGGATLGLTASNTYSGVTTVSIGNLELIGNGSIADSVEISINSGATLQPGNGTFTLNGGQRLDGNGTVSGNLQVNSGATVAPGTSVIGLFAVNGNATMQGTTQMKLNPSLLTNDVLQVGGTLNYGGRLVLTNLGGTYAANEQFKLFNAAGCSGVFTDIVPAIPAVNLAWNTNTLSNGVLSIVSSPTPPPRFGKFISNAGQIIFSGSNGVANWPYDVLASTNVGLPLANWAIVCTNYFDASGNFTVTNSGNSSVPTFYLLKLQ